MSIVSQRNAQNPNYTNSGLKYYYSFVQPPDAWSAQAPRGIICDEKIMPNRDIDDAANGTDTWKVLRGVDLYFAAEGAYERYYAGNQFQLPGIWPRSTYTQIRNRGIIESNLWHWTQGNDPQVSIKYGIASCYDNLWLKGISSSSDLQTSYSTWADGTPIDGSNPPSSSGTRQGWRYFLDFAVGKYALSDMASRYEDFDSGKPLSGDAVRRVYYDMERLQWYMPNTGDGTSWNVSQQSTTGWTLANWSSFTGGFSPLPPTTPTTEIWHEERHMFDYGTSDQRGGYWCYYTNAGTYTCPRTGLLNANGSRTEYFGSEQACYLALHLTTGGDNTSTRDIYEFWKVPFSTTSRSGYVQVAYNDVSNAAYSMVKKWNAGVPKSFGSEYRWTFVYLEHISIVCKTSDRTDVSQLNWTWAPA